MDVMESLEILWELNTPMIKILYWKITISMSKSNKHAKEPGEIRGYEDQSQQSIHKRGL